MLLPIIRFISVGRINIRCMLISGWVRLLPSAPMGANQGEGIASRDARVYGGLTTVGSAARLISEIN